MSQITITKHYFNIVNNNNNIKNNNNNNNFNLTELYCCASVFYYNDKFLCTA